MNTQLVRQDQPLAEAIEQVVVGGDLSALSAPQRVSYYHKVCESVGLNPLTRPFEYLKLNGKLVLYARRDAADQLRTIHGISLSKPAIEYVDDLVIVTVEAINRQGRTDTDLGAVSCKGLQGEAKANAMMKAITKAKRRVTLSLAGLGWLDDTEVDSIPGAQRIVVSETGEIVEGNQDEPTHDNPFEDVEFTKPVVSKTRLEYMHILGADFHGSPKAWDEARPVWVEKASGGKVTSSKDLSPEQAEWVISSLKKRINERAQEAQPVAA